MSILKRGVVAALLLGATAVQAQRPTVKLQPRPEVPPPKPLTYPPIVFDSLPNGLRFAIVEQPELPLVVVRTAFAGAGSQGVSFLDPAGKAGAWGLLLSTLREGTTTRSAAQISDEVASLGAQFTFSTPMAFIPPWFIAPRSAWVSSLRLLGDMIANPSLPEAGFTRIQSGAITSVGRLPSVSYLNRVLYTGLYGAESQAAHFATAASMRAVTLEDAISLRDKYLRPQNTIIVVAGAVTAREVRERFAEVFGGWERGGTSVAPIVPAAAAPAPTTIYLWDTPGSAQATIVAGQLLPGRDHPDAAAVEALASVLGDFAVSSGSRVYRAFRLDRGLSYSPRVELHTRPVPEGTPLVATVSVSPAVVDTAITVLLRVFRELRQDRVATADELNFSKLNLIGRLPSEMERLDLVAFTVLASMRDRLPLDYQNRWIRSIEGLGLTEVQAAAAKYLDPDRMVITVAGDRARIEAALRATGLPVVIVDK